MVRTPAPKSPKLAKGQTALPMVKPCACGCGRTVPLVDPSKRGSGRPRRYFGDACRQDARRKRKWAAELKRGQEEAELRKARSDAELRNAELLLASRPELAQWVAIWKATLGAYEMLTPSQVQALADALDVPRFIEHHEPPRVGMGIARRTKEYEDTIAAIQQRPRKYVRPDTRPPWELTRDVRRFDPGPDLDEDEELDDEDS